MLNYTSAFAPRLTVGAIVTFLAIALTIAAVILLYIYVLPEKKRETLPKIGVVVHDILNFKTLFIESVLKFIYVFATVFCVISGLLSLITFNAFGLITLIVGPVAIRLTYELLMMFILLVKNVIEINKKMK